MEEEVTATFLRRVKTREALLNEVEREAAQEKTEKLAEVTRQIRKDELDTQLNRIKQLAEQEALLVDTLHQREIAELSKQYEEEIAAMKREQAEMLAKLEAYAAATDSIRKRAEVKQTLRKLPSNARTMVALLSAKGTWKPIKESYNDCILRGASSHYGLDPQSHSLTALAACGALEDTPNGIYTLYAVMAAHSDTLRPRMKGGFRLNHNSSINTMWLKKNMMEELNSGQSARNMVTKIRGIQKLLRDYGKELVAEGLLEP